MGMRNFFKRLKPYVKGFKLFSFIFIIISGTLYFIRKADLLNRHVSLAVKNSLTVDKNYLSVNTSAPTSLTKADRNLVFKLGLDSNISGIYKVNHKCRINDTLNSVIVFVDKDSIVRAIQKPIKIQ